MSASSGNSSPVAIVTGASRGIGVEVAAELGRRGYRLGLLARNQKLLQETARKLEGAAPAVRALACDVQEARQVETAFQELLDWGGRVDVLVNNAGVGVYAPVHRLSEADWDRQLNTNLRGVFYCSKAVIPQMIQQQSGHIVNISSLAGKNAFAGGSAYCASKWGLQGLTYCMAEDLRRYHIRVSVICPGSVHTEFTPHAGKDPKKMLQAGDVARVVGWLLEQEPQSFVSEVLLRPTQKP